MSQPDLLAALAPVIDALKASGVPYYVGGSLASSTHGIPRASVDADVVADLRMEDVDTFVARLADSYYIEPTAARTAIERKASFNVIHLATMIKVDVFVPGDAPYERKSLERASESVPVGPLHLVMATPEDTVIHKLLWYRKSGEVSERQWSDILGVLRVQGASLDGSYMREWATKTGVLDLLQRAVNAPGAE
jgi:hypothetical protein